MCLSIDTNSLRVHPRPGMYGLCSLLSYINEPISANYVKLLSEFDFAFEVQYYWTLSF